MFGSRVFWVLLTLQHPLLDRRQVCTKGVQEGLSPRRMLGSDLCCLESSGPDYRQHYFPHRCRNQRSR